MILFSKNFTYANTDGNLASHTQVIFTDIQHLLVQKVLVTAVPYIIIIQQRVFDLLQKKIKQFFFCKTIYAVQKTEQNSVSKHKRLEEREEKERDTHIYFLWRAMSLHG